MSAYGCAANTEKTAGEKARDSTEMQVSYQAVLFF
jgi:hypothetical protein